MAQVNELIYHELSKIISREIDFPADYLVTIPKVDTAADLKRTNVYLSILPSHFRGQALERLQTNLPSLQKSLNQRLVLKFTPKITFKIDSSEEKADRINRLLDSLHHSF